MNRRALPWLSGLAILVAGFLVYQAGPGETIVVPSGQAGDVEAVPASPSTFAAWPERMTIDVDEVLVVRFEPTPTSPPLPKRDTPTPTTSCPAGPGMLCRWPEPPPTPQVKPTATPLPMCSTPVPNEQCVMPSGSDPPIGDEASGAIDTGTAPCVALTDEWCE